MKWSEDFFWHLMGACACIAVFYILVLLWMVS